MIADGNNLNNKNNENKNNNDVDSLVRYKLFAQNYDGNLIIRNLEQNNYFVCTPSQLLSNKEILLGLSHEHIVLISAIAEGE